ncbi:hypothetical protein [Acetobacter sicerae]|uniref:hypothetical protein n=1 Tax=Acetobacter sicerae TaxID=85325 RepID=UPI001F552E16|nr:hypothetical protein [Acetobacter sicerae]
MSETVSRRSGAKGSKGSSCKEKPNKRSSKKAGGKQEIPPPRIDSLRPTPTRTLPPDMPRLPSDEASGGASILADLDDLVKTLRQRNLNNAVRLAMEAAQGRGELVDHFHELGRRFGSSTDNSPRRKKSDRFKVIEGGRA